MSIRVRCTFCAREYDLPEHFLGRALKCKGCGKSFTAKGAGQAGKKTRLATNPLPDDEIIAPARKKTKPATAQQTEAIQARPRRTRDADDDAVPPRRSSRRDQDSDDVPVRRRRARDEEDDDQPASNKWLWISLAAGGGGLVIIVLLCILLFRGGDTQPAQPRPIDVAQTDPPDPPPKNPVVKVKDPPLKAKDPSVKNPFDKNPPVQVATWKVQSDPSPELAEPARQIAPNSLEIDGFVKFVVPRANAAAFAIENQGFGKESFRVINAFTLQEIGAISGKMDLLEPVLSPDGKYVAGKHVKGLKILVNVWSVAQQRLALSIAGDNSVQKVEFAGNGHVVIVAIKGLGKLVQTWNVATGQKVAEFSTTRFSTAMLVSPGGKYLALPYDDSIDFYSTMNGQAVGRIGVPNEKAFFGEKSFSFSADGQELAAYHAPDRNTNKIISWKMADGTKTVQLSFKVEGGFSIIGKKSLDWLPDRSGWFVNGEVIVDYVSGTTVFALPKVAQGFTHFQPRLLGKDHLLREKRVGSKNMLEIVALPRDEIALAFKDARSGKPATGNPMGGEVSVPKIEDLGVKVLPPPSGTVAWKVPVEKLPTPANVSRQPIALACRTAEIIQIQHARPDVGKAVVLYAQSSNTLSTKKTVRVERLDLAAGKSLGSMELFLADFPATKGPLHGPNSSDQSTVQAALSPDGARLLTRKGKDARLAVWDLAGRKQLTEWAPYAGPARWFAFLDAERVLTCGGQNRLILWKLPECKAIYAADGFMGQMHLSPNGKLLLGSTGTSLELLDPASGERLGRLEPGGDPPGNFQHAAFSLNGSALAVMYAAGGNRPRFGFWNLASGAQTTNFRFRQPQHQPISWVGPQQVLCGQEVVDMTAKASVVSYGLPSVRHLSQPSHDSRFWLASDSGARAVLRFQSLPDATLQQTCAALAASGARNLIPEGTAFQVNVNSNVETVRARILKNMPGNLDFSGFKEGPGGMTLNISVQEAPTGAVFDYEITQLGKVGRKLVKVTERQITIQYTVTDAKGTLIYSQPPNVMKTAKGLNGMQGDNLQSKLDDNLRETAATVAGGIHVPANLFQMQGGLRELPIHVQLLQ